MQNWLTCILESDFKLKVAAYGDVNVYFGLNNANRLETIINEIFQNENLSNPEDFFKQRKLEEFKTTAAQFTSQDYNSPISSNIIFAVISSIWGLTAIYNEDMKALESKLNQMVESSMQKGAKVTSFYVWQATSDGYTFAISWTSANDPRGYLRGSNHPLGNPIKEGIEEQLGIHFFRDVKKAPNEWLISGLTPDNIPQLQQFFEASGYDTSVMSKLNVNDATVRSRDKFLITFDNVTANTDYHLSVNLKQFFSSRRETDLMPAFLDIVEKVFTVPGPKVILPKVAFAAANQYINRTQENIAKKREELIKPFGEYVMQGKYLLFLRGNFNIYTEFNKLLGMKKFDTTDLANKALMKGSELRKSGHIKVERIINGILDGYYLARANRQRLKDPVTGMFLPDVEKFDAEVKEFKVKKTAQEPFILRDKQIEGVRWLYSRQSALLGDETGAGKCLVGSSQVSINNKHYTLSEAWNKFVIKTQRVSDTEEWGFSDTPLFVHSVNSEDKIVKGKVNKLFRQKYNGTIITTKTINNKQVSHTPQHRFLTSSGWKNDISKGDYISSSDNMNELNYEKVASVKTQDWNDYVYDLCVEEHHNYIAENLICHNTEQLIIAASMRTKPENLWDTNTITGNPGKLATGKILIFTLASVVKQFAIRILQTHGLPDTEEFLNSPESPVKLKIEDMNIPNAKWLVLSYGKVNTLTQTQQERQMGDTEEAADAEEMVDEETSENEKQRKIKVAALMQQIKALNFDVMILDESHMVKSSTSNTSKNIELIGTTIPFKWGASATIAANKPKDLHHQLLATGNSMGFMSSRQFNKKYTGMKAKKVVGTEREYYADPSSARDFLNIVREEHGGFDGLDLNAKNSIVKDLAEEQLLPIVNEQIKSITDLHAMLILTDVYRRSTKKQIRPDLPEHNRNVNLIPTSTDERLNLAENVNYRLQNMELDDKKTDSTLTRLTAYRMQMALQKVHNSTDKAMEVIRERKKVLIFTCFKESAEALHKRMQSLLAPYGMIAHVAMGDDTGTDYKTTMINEFRNPNSNVKAFVLGVLSSGTGLDLPNIVNDVIVNDISWTPKDADQVEGRAFRINSESPVTTHYMVLQDTPDNVIYNTVQKKRDIAQAIQEIDEKYAEKIKTDSPVDNELKQAQEQHWALVMEQLISETAVQHFWTKQQSMLNPARVPRVASKLNWFQIVTTPAGLEPANLLGQSQTRFQFRHGALNKRQVSCV